MGSCTSSPKQPNQRRGARPPSSTQRSALFDEALADIPKSPEEALYRERALGEGLMDDSQPLVDARMRRLLQTAYTQLTAQVPSDSVQIPAVVHAAQDLIIFGQASSGAHVQITPASSNYLLSHGLVLILGFGGSNQRSLSPYRTMYSRAGFNVVSGTRPHCPGLRALFYDRIARALESAGLVGPQLLVHVCSDTGFCTWTELCAMQQGQQMVVDAAGHKLHESAVQRLQQLPDLGKLTAGIVHDCCPSLSRDTEMPAEVMAEYLYGIIASLEADGLTCISSQATHLDKDSIFQTIKMVLPHITPEFKKRISMSDVLVLDKDCALDVPRLFLYSDGDKLVPAAGIKAYIAQLEPRMQAPMQTVSFKRVPHMTLGTYKPDVYCGAIDEFATGLGTFSSSLISTNLNLRQFAEVFYEYSRDTLLTQNNRSI